MKALGSICSLHLLASGGSRHPWLCLHHSKLCLPVHKWEEGLLLSLLSEIPLCLSLIRTLIIRLPWIIWGDHIPRSSTYKHLQRHFSQISLHSRVLGRPIFWGTTVQPVTVLDNVSLKKILALWSRTMWLFTIIGFFGEVLITSSGWAPWELGVSSPTASLPGCMLQWKWVSDQILGFPGGASGKDPVC